MIYNLFSWCVLGLIAGGIARFVVPGRHPLGCLGTIGLGILGSFVGGFLGSILFSPPSDATITASGLLGSIIGSVIVLFVSRRLASGPNY